MAIRVRVRDEHTRQRMKRQQRRDTGPEMEIRRRLHAMGLRYRVDVAPLKSMPRRRADIVFRKHKVAVFVDGCFWHGCPEHGTLPENNREWWRAKLETNRVRDRHTDDALNSAGWTVVRVWEHETADEAALRIRKLLRLASQD